MTPIGKLAVDLADLILLGALGYECAEESIDLLHLGTVPEADELAWRTLLDTLSNAELDAILGAVREAEVRLYNEAQRRRGRVITDAELHSVNIDEGGHRYEVIDAPKPRLLHRIARWVTARADDE